MEEKQKPFWKENKNPITMFKFCTYEDERVLVRRSNPKIKKNVDDL